MKEDLQKKLLKTIIIEGIQFKIFGGSDQDHIGCIIAFCNEELKVINFTVYGWVNYDFLELYFKKRLPVYNAIFDELSAKGRHLKHWQEKKKYIVASILFEERRLKEAIIKRETIDYQTCPSNAYPTKIEIESYIKSEKGYSFNGSFFCKICYRKHTLGYSYLLRGYEFKVCTYCRSDIKRATGYIKFISTNMGHGK